MKASSPAMTDLTALLARVEAAEGPDRELDRAIKAWLEGRVYVSFQDDLANRNGATPPVWTASLDAALALCERVLPGWAVAGISTYDAHGGWGEAEDYRLPYACIAGEPFEEPGRYNEPPEWGRPSFEARAKTPALALLAALLKAKIAESQP